MLTLVKAVDVDQDLTDVIRESIEVFPGCVKALVLGNLGAKNVFDPIFFRDTRCQSLLDIKLADGSEIVIECLFQIFANLHVSLLRLSSLAGSKFSRGIDWKLVSHFDPDLKP